VRRVLLALFAPALFAQIFPLKDVRPGLRGAGRTVFTGDRIDEFTVEVLGVLENAGPGQSIILARLGGEAVERSGVAQGMSGSPVYLDGRLAGAVAMAFSFAREPIAGIRPIEEMLRFPPPAATMPRAALLPPPQQLALRLPPSFELAGAATRLVEIATPVSLGGFTAATVERFAPELRRLGLEPRQGVLGGGRPAAAPGDPSRLRPGSMISVQLLTGDMSAGAEGTVTHIDGRNVYAFGHRFLSAGATELPFARAEVLAVLPNLATSFKISAAREWMGAITSDHTAGVAGELGRRASMTPVSIAVRGSGRAWNYNIEMVRDRFLSPFLLQMALFSVIDATERSVGASTFALRGRIEFEGATPPVRLGNIYAGEVSVAAITAMSAALPLSYCLQSGLPGLDPANIAIEIESTPARRHWRVDQAWTSANRVRPGDTVTVTTLLADENGGDVVREARYTIPAGMPPGPLNFTVADGASANLGEYSMLLAAAPRTAAEMVAFLNKLRENSSLFVRAWRDEPSFLVQGREMQGAPPSVALLLSREQPGLAPVTPPRNRRLAEIEIDAGALVTGSRTITVEVIE